MTTSYSSRGELLSATLPGGTTVTYDHDPMGRRIAKRVNGTITEKYHWKDAITLLAVYDVSDNPIMRFSYADGRMPVSMTYSGNTYYLAYDQIGSLKAVTDASSNIVKKIDYDSFGSIISDTNPTMSIPFGFAGGLHDRDTKLVRFGARDYDPTLGRWTAKDPIDFAGGDTNLYGYAANDPINLLDPFGKTGQEIEFAIKTALPLIFAGIEFKSPSTLKAMGYGGDLLEILSGGSGILTAEVIATGSPSAPVLLPIIFAGLGGWEIGSAFNRIWERISGQPLGADIYDWLHHRKEGNPRCP